jgi:hypothetical protein
VNIIIEQKKNAVVEMHNLVMIMMQLEKIDGDT